MIFPKHSEDRRTLDFTDFGITEVPLVGCYTYMHAHPPLRQHIHQNVFEVCLLQHGRQPYLIGKERFELSAGDMLITAPGLVHGTASEPENRGRLYWFQLRRPVSGRAFLGLSPRIARSLFDALDKLPCRPYHNCDLLFSTFERLLLPVPESIPSPLLKVSIQNLLVRLLLDVLTLAGRSLHQTSSPAIQRALTHLSKNAFEGVTLKQLAKASGVSESYLKVHFPRETGMTPMEHLAWLRIEKAKHLLRETRQPITALALDLGFLTSQHFATVFKRLTGIRPSDYRSIASLAPTTVPPAIGIGPAFHPADPSTGRSKTSERKPKKTRLTGDWQRA